MRVFKGKQICNNMENAQGTEGTVRRRRQGGNYFTHRGMKQGGAGLGLALYLTHRRTQHQDFPISAAVLALRDASYFTHCLDS